MRIAQLEDPSNKYQQNYYPRSTTSIDDRKYEKLMKEMRNLKQQNDMLRKDTVYMLRKH